MPGLGRGPPGPAAAGRGGMPGRVGGWLPGSAPGRAGVGRGAAVAPGMNGLLAIRGVLGRGTPGRTALCSPAVCPESASRSSVAPALAADAAAGAMDGAGATGSATAGAGEIGADAGRVGADALASGAGAIVGAAGAAAFAGATFFGEGAAAAGKASRNLRATGASTVEEALLTNSPSSLSFASTSLLGRPSSFASSCTRALPATGLLVERTGRAFRTVRV